MKAFLTRFLAAGCVAFTVAATGAAEVKLATIDLKKVFDNYWKTKQATANLENEARELEKQRKGMLDDYEKAKDEYQKLLATASDAAVSSDERDKRKKAAEAKLREIQSIEQSVRQFDSVAVNQIDERKTKMREKIVDEITDVIRAKAKA
ncbi:MAG: OmpH family outer membrane protein, partial [Verrucomicrobia bacterium]|nr:OmpH family outer membrane protein [Verrucomicrobiota bacterium]